MKKINVRKGIKIFFAIWLPLVELMICVGIILLSTSNNYNIVNTLAYVALFLTVFNSFLFFFLGGFVKELTFTEDHIEIKQFRRKHSSLYSYEEYTFNAITRVNGQGSNRSTNYYLNIENQQSGKKKSYRIGLLTQKQREEINHLDYRDSN